MKQRMVLGAGLFLFFIAGINGFAQNTGRVNFGAYPADYPLAYFSMLGIYSAPTVRQFFGSDAQFATSFQGEIPATVTVESSNGTANEFTVQLLLTLNNPQGDTRAVRLLLTFRSDRMAEMSYFRHVRFVNLISGATSERRSTGTQTSDVEVLGYFLGVMELFWDATFLDSLFE